MKNESFGGVSVRRAVRRTSSYVVAAARQREPAQSGVPRQPAFRNAAVPELSTQSRVETLRPPASHVLSALRRGAVLPGLSYPTGGVHGSLGGVVTCVSQNFVARLAPILVQFVELVLSLCVKDKCSSNSTIFNVYQKNVSRSREFGKCRHGARQGVLAPRLPKEEEPAPRLAYSLDRLYAFRLLKTTRLIGSNFRRGTRPYWLTHTGLYKATFIVSHSSPLDWTYRQIVSCRYTHSQFTQNYKTILH
ncbi:unnamed protein product [Trichogramma brassicae]|uniref:Uncharacterized protein n=1 Tax=Trichogramma brassicae TaxID=86971 RepID=A0A6H5IKY6_9HYME|nr:unnamed protein product [Trichogramma brassicae]